jgi:hypothetical protein
MRSGDHMDWLPQLWILKQDIAKNETDARKTPAVGQLVRGQWLPTALDAISVLTYPQLTIMNFNIDLHD